MDSGSAAPLCGKAPPFRRLLPCVTSPLGWKAEPSSRGGKENPGGKGRKARGFPQSGAAEPQRDVARPTLTRPYPAYHGSVKVREKRLCPSRQDPHGSVKVRDKRLCRAAWRKGSAFPKAAALRNISPRLEG